MWRFLIPFLLSGSSLLAAEPVFDAIDYATPEKYLTAPASLGDQAKIKAQALTLKADTDQKTVSNVLDWMNASLKYQADLAYQWRNYDTVIGDGCYGGCADYAIACGVLLKSAGIPTVWVKTMDVPWIWTLKRGDAFQTWSGHVFLEVYLDGKWVLLDPGAKRVYPNYSPEMRILPGNRFAYHKGNDPKTMIMSLQWEDWKLQTRAYFSKLDPRLLPVDTVASVVLGKTCFVIGNSPYYQRLTKLAQQQGLTVAKSFNTGYDTYLPLAKGHILYIATHEGQPTVPIATLEKYFPNASAGIKPGRITIEGTEILFIELPREISINEKRNQLEQERKQLEQRKAKLLAK
ncbi:Transglutaminase-like superfamily protein [Gimesia maris]|uniref:transglutaminase-like domain-containing protein n=1 Tax=Gimesia maris TaxID=122 RepID=UPI0011889DDF|nr:transglutaminase domain-containing protein [Gimesia maris]QDU16837.1 Transglutaminase-like superfamily protein [Gimesia maris]